VVEDIDFYEQDKHGRVGKTWAEAQMRTTADFSHGSWLMLHLSGGLNYQVVHHLFPGVAHPHYPQLAPIIKRTAEEFDLPYIAYSSFREALSKHFKHLKRMGAEAWVPSLQTVG
jgi:fatty acid desaturase